MNKPILFRVSLILFPCLFFGILLLSVHAGFQQGNLSSHILRLHVLGNSNSPADQELKLRVRDDILAECGHLFRSSKNLEDALFLGKASVSKIQAVAQQTLQRHGCSSPVTVCIEDMAFPTKNYGSVTLPAGKYSAVTVRIGEAKGENWWCVLYPPLCLTQGSVDADESTLALLKQHLPPEEFALITQPKELTLRFKFRILEILGKLFS